jgi:hypothetical protein
VTHRYDFHGVRLEIVSEVAAVGDAIDGRLRHFRSPAGGDADWRYELCRAREEHTVERPTGSCRPVYDAPEGEVLYFPEADVLWIDVEDRVRIHSTPTRTRVSAREQALDELWLLSRPLFTIPLLEALKRRGLYALHAAAAAQGDGVLLMPGTTGAGKSTLAVALARAGWEFLADDMVFLARDGEDLRVLGFPDEVDVSPRSASWFPELRAAAGPPAGGWPKHRVRLDEALGARVGASGAPSAIAFPSPAAAEVSTLEPLAPDAALLELAPNVLLTHEPSSQAHLDALALLVARARAHRLATGRDFDAVASLLAGLLPSSR